jgi:predicted DNA-binding mobile mystery protein A
MYIYTLTTYQFLYSYKLTHVFLFNLDAIMNTQDTVLQQYQRIVDHANLSTPELKVPPEGWLRTVRKACGISGAQLARKTGVTRARVAQAEMAENSGGITIKSMQTVAEAMGCRFVYAILPPAGKKIEEIIFAQAMKKARALAERTDEHMSLEGQSLLKATLEDQIKRLAQRLALEMAPDFWNDK